MADRVDLLLKSYDAANVTLEAKANTILGFLGAGVGVVSVVSAGDHTGLPAFTPLLVVGFVLVLFSLAHCILALWARVDYVLNLEPFCQLDVMSEANAKAKLTAKMAHSALLVQYDALRPQMLKNAAVKGAQVFFAFGAAAFAVNLLFALAATRP